MTILIKGFKQKVNDLDVNYVPESIPFILFKFHIVRESTVDRLFYRLSVQQQIDDVLRKGREAGVRNPCFTHRINF